MSARWLVSAAIVVVAGCGGSPSRGSCSDGPPCALDCGPAVDAPPNEGQLHVPEPTMVDYQSNPPASGPHWPMWQEPWQPYPDGLPRERWVHNLEHGGIVLLYNCPGGCDDVVGELTALWQATPPDRYNEQRVLIVPDSAMPHKVAAIAWGWRWQGESVDSGAIRCFMDARYDRAPESIP
ncbi:MAG TPA: DUF3105 domain-containing protein [Polyangia bacterium]|nr:DUF3105 domain-containing protein [Polyangia bacterium]